MEIIKVFVRWFFPTFFPRKLAEKFIRETGYFYCDPEFNGQNFPFHSWPEDDRHNRFRPVSIPHSEHIGCTVEEGLNSLKKNWCTRPTRQDAVIFGYFVARNPEVFSEETYVFLHEPVPGDLRNFVTVFTKDSEGKWTVVVNKTKVGELDPSLFPEDTLIGIHNE